MRMEPDDFLSIRHAFPREGKHYSTIIRAPAKVSRTNAVFVVIDGTNARSRIVLAEPTGHGRPVIRALGPGRLQHADKTIGCVRSDLPDMPRDVLQSNHPLRLKNRHIPKAIAAITPSAVG